MKNYKEGIKKSYQNYEKLNDYALLGGAKLAL